MSTSGKAAVALPPSTVPTSSPLALPSRLFVPLPENAAAEALKPGTRVTRGQQLVHSGAGNAHVPLAPAAGTIAGTREVQLLDGRQVTALEIEVDQTIETSVEVATSTLAPKPETNAPPSLSAFIDRLRQSGVSATRHTSPDLMGQLHDAAQRKVDVLICNLLDVDGGSSLHAKVIRESGPLVVAGINALARALGAEKAWLAADPSLASRVSVLVRKASARGGRIKVETLENDYPQSDPTLLLYALTGRRLRPGDLPTKLNALVLDGVAAAAVGRCIERDEAMLSVPVEIRDSTRARSHVAVAAVGTPLSFVLESMGLHGAFTLRGAALRDVRVSANAVVSGNGELSIDAGAVSTLINPDPCIRSGWCVENCPVSINPAALLEAAQDNDSAMAETYGLHACIECGICSYVCPSRLPLLTSIRDLRKQMSPPAVSQ